MGDGVRSHCADVGLAEADETKTETEKEPALVSQTETENQRLRHKSHPKANDGGFQLLADIGKSKSASISTHILAKDLSSVSHLSQESGFSLCRLNLLF